MAKSNVPQYLPPTLPDWRAWLEANHQIAKGLWVVFAKKDTGISSISVNEAIDEALCFGWVDSVSNGIDEEPYKVYFAPRNPKSNWSRVNKEKIARLEAEGRLAEAGQDMVRIAKSTGTWTALDEVENLIVPPDLQAALESYQGALENWEAFPRSAKRGILEWLLNAKRPDTRAKRVEETAQKAANNERANQWPR